MKHFFRILVSLSALFTLSNCNKKEQPKVQQPNVLFVLMDDLGYGQFGIYNDTITTADFNPFFVSLVDSLQGYSLEKSLEYSKTAIPTLTKLAKEGVTFTNAYTSSNVCSPSRLGMITGILQNRWGIYTNDDSEQSGIRKGTHLAEKIKASGYRTAHIGKWHIGQRNDQILHKILTKHQLAKDTNFYLLKPTHPELFNEIRESGYLGSVVESQNPLNHGFDYYYGYNHWASQYYNSYNIWENRTHLGKQAGYNTDVFTEKAIEKIDESLQENKPFYVQLHYHAVHDSVELKAPDKYLEKFNSDSFELNNFYAHLYAVDKNIEKIVDFLKAKEAYKNTIIVFTSDNGAMSGGSYDGHKSGSPLPGNTPFSGHKGNYYLGGFRVPFFIHWPNGIKQQKLSNTLVSTMDILPTVLDAVGTKVPDSLDGKSLLSLLNNQKEEKIHDYLLWSGVHATKWGYLIANSTKTHADEDQFAPPAWVVIKDNYLLRFTGKIEAGLYYDQMAGRAPVLELFDIKNDPSETKDISKDHPDKVKEMKAIYFKESKNFPRPIHWEESNWHELKKEKV